jgi:hypothetical protein
VPKILNKIKIDIDKHHHYRAIHNDPSRYQEPRSFDPTRYMHDKKSARESALSADVTERDHFLFGAGRRICSGIDISENSLFLVMARVLWAFNISKAVGLDGLEITPDPEDVEEGIAAIPSDFPARFIARSEERAQAVKSEWNGVEKNLSRDDAQWIHVPKDLDVLEPTV